MPVAPEEKRGHWCLDPLKTATYDEHQERKLNRTPFGEGREALQELALSGDISVEYTGQRHDAYHHRQPITGEHVYEKRDAYECFLKPNKHGRLIAALGEDFFARRPEPPLELWGDAKVPGTHLNWTTLGPLQAGLDAIQHGVDHLREAYERHLSGEAKANDTQPRGGL